MTTILLLVNITTAATTGVEVIVTGSRRAHGRLRNDVLGRVVRRRRGRARGAVRGSPSAWAVDDVAGAAAAGAVFGLGRGAVDAFAGDGAVGVSEGTLVA